MTGLLIFGRTGQVAQELARLLPDARFLGRDEADLSDPDIPARMITDLRPATVINATAYTAVDRAESEADIAQAVNAAAPGAMARGCALLGVPFLHISTDYVFDGTGDAPRAETALTAPLGVYGSSKRDGELAVAAAGGHWVVLRTSWVFSAHGTNFVKTMLRLGSEREELGIVADQVGGPTPAAEIARTLLKMAEQMSRPGNPYGMYHYAGAPDVSWADFAREIFARSGQSCRVKDITTADYPTPARRPANSRLDCAKLAQDFGIGRPDWRAGLDDVLHQLGR